MHNYLEKIDLMKKNNKFNLKRSIISIDIGKNKRESSALNPGLWLDSVEKQQKKKKVVELPKFTSLL